MLSLGPGSACDVCLDPFGAESKAPCSITCGHVFCVNCLQQVSRLTCPLCRVPFDTRYTIRLHIDLDNISPSSPDIALPSNADDGARHLQNRITDLATNGATEAQSTQLREECKRFLQSVPKGMYSDLLTSYKMLAYMCHVKRNFLDQGREFKTVSQEVDRLKAALEVLKIEKRNLEQALSTERESFSSERERLHMQLDNAQAQMQLLTEQNDTAQNQLILLNEEIQRLRSETEFSSPEGESPTDFCDSPSQLPPSISVVESDSDAIDTSAPFLTPWEGFGEPKALTDDKLSEDPPSHYVKPNSGYCGAAGCPHSCDCVPFILFSPGSRDAAAANFGRSNTLDGSVSAVLGPIGAPSGLSLALKQARARSRSRSHSRPRSRSLSRAPSPSKRIPTPPSGSPIPSMSASIPILNPHYELRGQLQDILRDPAISSSLPNMPPSHFPSSPLSREYRNGAGSAMEAAALKDRSVPRDGHLYPPMAHHSDHPSPLHTSTPLFDPVTPQRPLLYRSASSVSQAADELHRSDKERRRSERAAAAARPPPLSVPETRLTSTLHPPMIRPLSHNISTNASSSFQESSAVHPPMIRPPSHNLTITPSSSASSSALPSPIRPQFPHASSSQRVPSSATSPPTYDAMPRAQASAPSPPIPHAHQPSTHRMPRAQAHAPPALTTSSVSRPHTKPPSPSSSSPASLYHAPPPVAVPLTLSPVGHTARATYDTSPSRHAQEDTYPLERVRGSETRGGHAVTREMSKRMLPHAVAPTPNSSILYAQ